MPHFTATRLVQFHETDLAGIVHFSNFYRYMEEAEHDYFRALGLSIMEQQPDGVMIGWPRVRGSCAFESPAFYGDLLEIDITVTRVGAKSLSMQFDFRRGEQRLAKGDLKTVCCICEQGHKLTSIEIPPKYLARIEASLRGTEKS